MVNIGWFRLLELFLSLLLLLFRLFLFLLPLLLGLFRLLFRLEVLQLVVEK